MTASPRRTLRASSTSRSKAHKPKGVGGSLKPLAGLIRSAFVPAGLLLTAGSAFAGPTGGQVVGGKAQINTPNATTTIINQQSHNVSIDWTSFNIGKKETVQFDQPSSSASALNRIFNQNPTQIFGVLRANGQVILVNPNGVFFSPTAKVSVGSLIASGLNITTEDFMAGDYDFSAPEGQDGGMVINQGLIEAASGGSVSLIGGAVQNEGVILATAGQVTLAAGNRMAIDFDGDGLIRFAIDEKVLQNAHSLDAAVSNTGEINADGGSVVLKGKAARDVFTNVVNNAGVIHAGRIDNEGGIIRLVANGGASGNSVLNTGTLDASGTNGDGGSIHIYADDTAIVAGDSVIDVSSSDGEGGTIRVLGEQVGLFNDASLDASGANGGGAVLVGGDYQGSNPEIANAERTYVGSDVTIKADAAGNGDGGKVIVWADEWTKFFGNISARGGVQGGDGGFAEVSSKQTLGFAGSVNLSAAHGTSGNLLLDPDDIIVQDSVVFTTLLAAGDLDTDDTLAFDEGVTEPQIIDADAITAILDGGTTVTLQANDDITIDEEIDGSGSTTAGGGLILQAGDDVFINADILTADGDVSITALDGSATPVAPDGTGDIEMADGVTIDAGSGLISLSSEGDITLENLTTSGNIDITSTSGSILRTSNDMLLTGSLITLNAGTDVGASGARIRTNADNLDLSAAAGDVFISEADNVTLDGVTAGNDIFIATTAGDIDLAGSTVDASATPGNVTLNASGSLLDSVGASLILGGTVTLVAGVDIGDVGGNAIGTAADNLNLTATTGDIAIDEADDVTIDEATAAGAMALTAGGAVVLSGTSSVSSLDLVAGGSITDDGTSDLTVTNNASFDANGGVDDILLLDDYSFGSLTFVGATVDITEADSTQLAGTSSADDLTLTSAAGITDAANTDLTVTNDAVFTGTSISLADNAMDTLDIGGNADFEAGAGTITIAATGAVDFDSLTFNTTAGAVSITEDSDTVLAGVSTANSLVLTSGGQILDDGSVDLTVGVNAKFDAGANDITLDDVYVFGSLTFIGGAVDISEANGTQLSGTSTADSLTLTSGAGITDAAGSVTVANDASFTGTIITLTNAAGETLSVGGTADFDAGAGAITVGALGTANFGSLTFNTSAGAVSITEDSNTDLTGTSTANSLTLVSGGALSDDGSVDLTVTNNASFDGTSITLADAESFGTLTFNSAGTVDISEDNAMVLAGANTAGSLVLTAEAGTITDGTAADITATGNATFIANGTGGAVTIGNDVGNADSFVSLTFSSVGAVSVSEDNAMVLSGVSDADSLSLTTEAGSITDDGTSDLTVTGTASFTANGAGGAIALDDTYAFGDLTFNSVGAVDITEVDDTDLTGTNTALSLVLTSGGAINDDAAADLAVTNNASFDGTDITLGDAGGNTTNFGSLTFNSAGAVTITEDTAMILAGTSTADSLSLTTSAGSITDNGSTDVTVANNANFTANGTGGAITLDETYAFGDLTFNSVGAVSITEVDDTDLTGTNTALSLVLTSGGAINDDAAADLAVTNNASFDGTDITLGDAAGNTTNFGSLTFNSGGAVDITEDTAMILAGTSTADSLALTTSVGSITDNSATDVTVTNNANFTANGTGGAITLDETYAFGDLTFNSVGAVSITEVDDTDLTGTNTASSLVLISGGAINDDGTVALTVTNNASFAGTDITLDDDESFGTLTFAGTGTVDISEDNAMVLAGTNTADDLVLTAEAGTITDGTAADITTTGNATFVANGTGGAVTIGNDAGNADSFASLTFSSVGAVSISQDDAMVLSGTSDADSLSLTTEAGSITDDTTADVTVTNTATLTANGTGGAITLADVYAFGDLTFNSAGAVDITEADDTDLTGTNTALSLVLTSGGEINDDAAADLAVTNNASFDGTDITLGDAAGNTTNFGSLTFNSTGDVDITEDSAMILAGTSSADNLTLTTATGSITDATNTDVTVTSDAVFTGTSISLANDATDTLDIGGNADFEAGAGAITVAAAGAVDFGTLTFNSSAAAVSITEDSDTDLTGTNTANSLTLTSGGAISDDGTVALTVTNNASFAGTDITLDDDESFGTLTFAGTGTVDISEDNAMVLAGTNTADDLVLTAEAGTITDGTAADITTTGNATFVANGTGGAITIGNDAGNADSFTSLTFSSVGAVSISEDNAMVLSGTSDADSLSLTTEAGSITDDGSADVTVTNTATLTANGTGGAITLADAYAFGDLTFNSVGAVDITEVDDTDLTGTNTALSLVLTSGGAINDDANADLAVTNNASFDGTDITLGDAAGNTTNFGSLTFNSAGAVDITEDTAMILAGTSTADSLSLTTSAGSITDTGTFTVTNDTTLDSAAAIVLDTATNDFGGDVFVDGATNVTLVDATDITLVDISASGTITVDAQDGMTITGTVASSGGGDVALNADSDADGGLFDLQGTGAINTNGGDLDITASDMDFAGTMDLTGGALALHFTVAGDLCLGDATGGCQITLDNTDLASLTAATGDLSLDNTGAAIRTDSANINNINLTLLGSTINDEDTDVGLVDVATLTMTTTGAIGGTSGGADGLTVTADAVAVTSTGGNAVTLTSTGDNGNTSFNIATGGAGTVSVTQETSNLVVGAVSTTGNVDLTASTGSILDNANDAVTDITGSAVTLTAANGVGQTAGNGSIDTNAASLNVSVTGAGLINLAEANGVDLLDIDTTNGSITITTGGATTVTDVVAGTAGSDVSITASTGDITVATVTAAAGAAGSDVTLTASNGAILDDGANGTKITGGLVNLTATGAVGAAGANGQIDTTAVSLNVTAGSGGGAGAIFLDESDAVTLADIDTANGGITITTGGATVVTDVAAGTAGSDVSIIASTGNMTVATVTAAAGAAGSDVTLTASNGAILDDGVNGTKITGGLVDLTATGAVGAAGANGQIDTTAVSLNVTAGSGGGAGAIFLEESDAVTLADIDTANGGITITTGNTTTVTDVAAGTAGSDVSIIASNGNMTVATVTAAAGAAGSDVTLTAQNGAILDDGVNGTKITGGLVDLTATGAVGAAGANNEIDTTAVSLNVTAGSSGGAGAIFLDESDAVTLADIDTANGGITITTGGATVVTDVAAGTAGSDVSIITSTGNMTVATVTAAAGAAGSDVTLTAQNGAILDDGVNGTKITGGLVDLTATGAVGAAGANNEIDTTAVSLNVTAGSSGGAGAIFLDESDAVTLADIDTANGGITITTGNTTTVTDVAAGTAGSDVSIIASNGNMTVATVTAAAGAAGSDVTLTASSGAILDDGVNATKITGGLVNLTATGAVGAAGANGQIDTTAVSLNVTAGSSGGAGAIFLEESDGVNLADIDTANGGITITTGNTTTITDVQSGTNGAVSITASNGNIEVDTFSSGTGAGSIIATGGAITDADDNSTVSAGVLTLTAQSGIGAGAGLAINTTASSLDASVTAAGNMFVNETDGINLSDVDTANGTITILTAGNTTITDVQSGSNGAVNVTASTGSIEVDTFSSGTTGAGTIVATTGAITDANDNSTVTAGALTLTAQSGIGAGAGLAINTTATSLDASVTAAGNMFVNESDGINLADVDTNNGTITITTAGATTITDVQSGGNGAVSITASTGSIEVGTFSSGTGAGSIISTAGAITDTNADSTVSAGALTLTAATGIGASGNEINTTVASLDGSVTGAGSLFVDETDAINLLDVDTANGAITITAGGAITATDVVSTTDNNANDITLTGVGIAVGVVDAGPTAGDVTLDAGTGAITDSNGATTNVTAQVLTADAQGGISLDTVARSFDIANTGTGNVNINNVTAGAATLTNLTNTAAGGSISFVQTGGGDISVTGGVSTNNGAIALTTANEILLGAVTIDAGTSSITLTVDSGNAIAATMDLAGSTLNANTISLTGNGNNDTLISQNQASTFLINGANSGTLTNGSITGAASAGFSGFANLTGTAANDIFHFTTGALAAGNGTVDGAGGTNELDFTGSAAVTVTLNGLGSSVGFQGSVDVNRTDFDNITVLTGSGNTDTLVGRNAAAAWGIDGTNQYVSGNTLNFAAMENLTGGSGVDTFTLSANHTGNVNGGIGSDRFNFTGTASLTGSLNGGAESPAPTDTLDFSGSTLTLVTDLNGVATSHGSAGTITGTPDLMTGGFDNIDALIGNNGQLFGPAGNTFWMITDANEGTFGATLATIANSSFDAFSIQAGNGNDTFIFQNAGTVGRIDNGINGGGGVNVLVGSVDGDTFTITNAVTTPGANVNGTSVRVNVGGTGNITDLTNIDVIDGAAASDTGADVFNINVNWIGSLAGSGGSDVFTFAGASTVGGALVGGAGSNTLNLSASTDIVLTGIATTGAGFQGTALGLIGVGDITNNTGFDDIRTIVGSAGNDSLRGVNAAATWTIVGGIDTYASGNTLTFSDFETLTGGAGIDTVNITGSHTGSVSGGGGDDLITLSAGGSVSGNIAGGADNDTLTSSGPFVVNGANSGTADGGNFNTIENLTGTGAANTFTFENTGSLDGTADGQGGDDLFDMNGGTVGDIVGGGGADTLDLTNAGSPITVTLTAADDILGFDGTSTDVSRTFAGINEVVGGNGSGDSIRTNLDNGTFTINGTVGTYAYNPTLNFSKFETVSGSSQRDTFNIQGPSAIDLIDNNGVNIFNFNQAGLFSGSVTGGAGVDTFNFNQGTASGALKSGAGSNIFTFNGGSATGVVTIGGQDTWNYKPGKSLGTSVVGGEGTSLTIPGTLGANITVSAADLNLPTLNGFNGHLIIGGTMSPPSLPPTGSTTVNVRTDLLTIERDIITSGDITLMAADVTLHADLSAGGEGGDDILILALGGGTTANPSGNITAVLQTGGAPVIIQGGSLTMIAVNTIIDPSSINIELGGTGPLLVATGSDDSLEFGVIDADASGDLLAQLGEFLDSLSAGTGGGVDVSGSQVRQANLVGNLIGIEQLAFIDVGLFEEDLSLFGVIGQGVALALAQCEEVEGCAPNVTEAELKDLIEKLDARIAELERRLADAKSGTEKAQIEKLLTGYRAELKNFNSYKAQLDAYAKAEAEDAEDLEDDISGEDFGGASDVATQVKKLSDILEMTKRRADWLDGLKADAAARDKLSKSTGIELTIEALDEIINATRKEAKFIEQQIQQLLEGTQASLEPFRAESGDYSMIRSIGFGPELLKLDSTSVAAVQNWY